MRLRGKRKLHLNNKQDESDSEQMKLEQILKASRLLALNSCNNLKQIPICPVYYPSETEFSDPLGFIRKIQFEAVESGICKIVPPMTWKPPDPNRFYQCPKKFETKKQFVHRLQEGYGHEDGRLYSCQEYEKMGKKFTENFVLNINKEELQHFYSEVKNDTESKRSESFEVKNLSNKKIWDRMNEESRMDFIEKKYWEIVERGIECEVEYGSDIPISKYVSGFEDQTGFNIKTLPDSPTSLLRFLKERVSGVNEPWVYFGMLFSTFCWHYEDDNLFSISYNHTGSPKLWYGVSGSFGEKLVDVFKSFLPDLFEEEPDLMMKLATMLNPLTLISQSVPVVKSIHKPGEFMITFPHAFHAGFNMGFNIAEAVNFAIESWLPYGLSCADEYKEHGRESILFPERMAIRTAYRKCFSPKDAQFVVLAIQKILNDEEKVTKITRGITQTSRVAGKVFPGEAKNNMGVLSSPTIKANLNFRHDNVFYDEDLCEDGCEGERCVVCKKGCFVSYVKCSKHDECVGCHEHADEMCRCDLVDKKICYRYTCEELRWLLNSIKSKF